MNDRIRATHVLLIGPDGEKIGEKGLFEAMQFAKSLELDLVEISPNSTPPVCRVMDFGKFKYDLSKQEKSQIKKEGGLKEVRLSAKIDAHDLNFKAKRAAEFIEKGYQVRVSMRLVGRENIFVDRALGVFKKFADAIEMGFESTPRKIGNRIESMLTKVKKEDAKTENPQRNG